MIYDLFALDSSSPLIHKEPLVTMRNLGLINSSNVAQPHQDFLKVLRALESKTKYERAYWERAEGKSDPGNGPYETLRVRLSDFSSAEGVIIAPFRITWVFNKQGFMLACQAERE